MKTDTARPFWVKKLTILATFLGSVLIVGCSSGVTRVQTWDGDGVASGQAAVLSAPSEINVKQVNDQTMADFLVDDLALDYELLPGENQIVFTYKTIWAKGTVVENGESKVHVVETPRLALTLDAEAGETYRFEFDKPTSREEAEAMKDSLSVSLVNASGQAVATSSVWTPADRTQSVARAPVPASKSPNSGSETGNATTLQQMKSLWGNASEEEKREFLRWAFE